MANDNTIISSQTKDLRFAEAINKVICSDVLHWAHSYSSVSLSQTAVELSQLESCSDGSVDASSSLCDLL